MIINNNPNPDLSSLSQATLDKTQESARAAASGASTFATTDSTPGGDSISLSNSSNLVQQALNSSSSARAARIQELKALVQSNQYLPDAQEVSGSIIDSHLEGA
jgi:flagellar biosynthesis anti-sigma factor FlgM